MGTGIAPVFGSTSNEIRLRISRIRRDGGTQCRIALDEGVIKEYAHLMDSGFSFPPVRAWWDGADYWLSDGFHRVAAAEWLGLENIVASIFQGTLEDARWDSYAANATHGIRRTPADVRELLMRAFLHPKAAQLSTRELARHLRLPETTVRRWRNSSFAPAGADRLRIAERGGREYSIDTTMIGHSASKHSSLLSQDSWRKGLKEMKELSSPQALPLVVTFEKWMLGRVSTTICLEMLEDLLKQ